MKPFVLKKHQALVWSLAFSPDGNTMASGSADNNVVIWDVPTGEDLMTLKHNGTIEALKFSPDGRLLASASHEPSRGSVCLWRAPADEEAPQNTLRSTRPAVFDRPANLDSATAMRPAYSDPLRRCRLGGDPPAAINPRSPADPVVPMPASYSRSDEDRYSRPPLRQPGPAGPPQPASTDPSVPLQTGGSQSLGNGSPAADGLTPPGGFSQPAEFPGRSQRRPAEEWPARSPGVLNRLSRSDAMMVAVGFNPQYYPHFFL